MNSTTVDMTTTGTTYTTNYNPPLSTMMIMDSAIATASDFTASDIHAISEMFSSTVSKDEDNEDCRFQPSQRLKLNTKKRSRQVRFKEEDSSFNKDTLIKKASESRRRKNKKISLTTTWYTPQEIKDSYKSIIIPASKEGKSWFSIQKRKKRRIKRNQMYKILKAVQEYEVATQTKAPDLLSQLLDRHSKSMVQEAIRIASENGASTDVLFA